ncbi:MAG: hypothetical protein IKA50_03345 [Clostridia bacterium]|nr:hypothetical protein [Clostridia bacterium]
MKRSSKWLALLLAVSMCLTLCACGLDVDNDRDDDDRDDVRTTAPSFNSSRPTVSIPNIRPTQDQNDPTWVYPTQDQNEPTLVYPTQSTVRPTHAQSGNSITVPALSVNRHSVPALPQSTTTMKEATFKTFTGSISQKNETDTFSYTPPRDGTYRFDLVNIVSGLTFTLTVKDSLGAQVMRHTNLGNNGGFVVEEMKGGQKYTIELKQYSDFGNYTIRVGEQTATVDVSAYSVVKDSIAFRNQRNYYTFTPAVAGRYQLYFAEVMSGPTFTLTVYDALGGQVMRQTNMGNNDGIKVDLEAGVRYTIEVKQYNDVGAYQLKIGKQKATVNVTNYSEISDSIEFRNQRNYYTFAPAVDGRYRFEFANVKSGVTFYLYVYNDLGETVQRQSNTGNNSGFTVDGLEAGEVYTIMVEQYSDLGNYTLKIGKQKETVSVRAGMSVNDHMEYNGQYNNYTFTATGSEHTLSLSGMPGGTDVSIYVLNELGERVGYQSSMSNGNTLKIRGLTAGATYTIQVRYYSGTGAYTLKIN